MKNSLLMYGVFTIMILLTSFSSPAEIGGSRGQETRFGIGGSRGQETRFEIGGSRGQETRFEIGGSRGQETR